MYTARLPEQFEEKTIRSLPEGESAYVVPWAMHVDEQRRCWLRPSMTTDARPHGTVSMLITRTADGFSVRIPEGYRYTPGSNGVVCSDDPSEYLPVVEIF